MTEQSTSLAVLKQNTALSRPGDNATEVGFHNGEAFALLQRVATMFAGSTMVPERYRGNVGNCAIAINMAHRMGADYLMVAQNLYVVHGTPAWSAQFMVATFNASKRFSALTYKFQGKENTDSWGCRAVATELATGKEIEGTLVTIGMAKTNGWYEKNGSKWKVMPEQMLRYRAAAWFVRAYAPEISMGLMTVDEAIEIATSNDDVYTAEITTETIKKDAAQVSTRTKHAKGSDEPISDYSVGITAEPEDNTQGYKVEILPQDTFIAPEEYQDVPFAFSERDDILANIRDEMRRLGNNTIPATLQNRFGTEPEEIQDVIILKSLLSTLKTRK